MSVSGHLRKRKTKDNQVHYQAVVEAAYDRSTGKRKRIYKTVKGTKKQAEHYLREMIAETEKVSKKSKAKKIAESPIYSEIPKKNVQDKTKLKNHPYEKNFIDPNSSYEVTNNESLGSLFDENDLVLKDETKVTAEGAAYKEVPLIITKVYDDNVALNANSDNSLGTKVSRMYANGMTVEEIALELDCSTSEVQFIIDMGL